MLQKSCKHKLTTILFYDDQKENNDVDDIQRRRVSNKDGNVRKWENAVERMEMDTHCSDNAE
jgi:hypothetical protein